MGNAEWGMGKAEWGMRNAEMGMRNGEWGMKFILDFGLSIHRKEIRGRRDGGSEVKRSYTHHVH